MKLSLVVLTAGKSQGQAIPITLSQFTIGRDPGCNLRPASASISKRHCAVLVREGKVFLKDFGSTNGTFVNDVAVKGEVPLKNNDLLKIGPLEFKVALEAGGQATRPTPPPSKPETANMPPPAKAAPGPAKVAGKVAAAAKTAPKEAAAQAPPPAEMVVNQPAGAAPGPVPDSGSSDDESVAALLLSLGDEGAELGEESTSAGDSGVPSGSTIMDVVSPLPPADAKKTPENSKPEAGAKKPESKPGDTAHLAAKAILDKYTRRQRS